MLLDAQNNCLATLQLRLLSMFENAFRVQLWGQFGTLTTLLLLALFVLGI